jgi:hypothetical protein
MNIENGILQIEPFMTVTISTMPFPLCGSSAFLNQLPVGYYFLFSLP